MTGDNLIDLGGEGARVAADAALGPFDAAVRRIKVRFAQNDQLAGKPVLKGDCLEPLFEPFQ